MDETAREVKISNAIAAIDKDQLENIIYHYRPLRSHLTTRFGSCFIMTRLLYRGQCGRPSSPCSIKDILPQQQWINPLKQGMYREIREKAGNCPSCRTVGKNLRTQLPSWEKNRLQILSELNQATQLDFAGPVKSKTRGDVYLLVAIDRFSKWPTSQICRNEILFR